MAVNSVSVSVLGSRTHHVILMMMMMMMMMMMGVLMVITTSEAVEIGEGFSCPGVIKSVASCNSFLFKPSKVRPSVACCAAAERLDNEAMKFSAGDRKDLCFCLSILGQNSVPSHAFAIKSLCKLDIVKIVPENQC